VVDRIPGGGEISLAGPALVPGGAGVAYGYTDADGAIHVRTSGREAWSASAPEPPPPSGPDDHSVRTVSQRLVGVAAASGRLAFARLADLTVEPACVNSVPACEIAVMARPYYGQLLTGTAAGPFTTRQAFGPDAKGDCRDRRVTALDAAAHTLVTAENPAFCTDGSRPAARVVARRITRGPGHVVARSTRLEFPLVAAAHGVLAWVATERQPADPAHPKATLTIAERGGRRVRERLRFALPGGQPPAGLAVQSDGTAALLLPPATSGPCGGPYALAWTSPRSRRLHRLSVPAAVTGAGLRLTGGRALLYLERNGTDGQCPAPGSLAEVRLRDGATKTIATLAAGETPSGTLDLGARTATYAVVVAEPGGTPAYSTEIRSLVG
jgi:hypothetical protein